MFPSEKARASQGLLKSYHTIEKPQITQTVDDLVSIYCTWNLYMTQFLHFGQILISALSLKTKSCAVNNYNYGTATYDYIQFN